MIKNLVSTCYIVGFHRFDTKIITWIILQFYLMNFVCIFPILFYFVLFNFIFNFVRVLKKCFFSETALFMNC